MTKVIVTFEKIGAAMPLAKPLALTKRLQKA